MASISLPTLPADVQDVRSVIEDFIIDLFKANYSDSFMIEKYFETPNEMLYNDCVKRVQSGVPNILVRTRSEQAGDFNPHERGDDLTANIEIIFAVPVKIEKNIPNVDRYAYTMHYLTRELLRNNRIQGIRRMVSRPFVLVNNRDVFRNEKIDIIIAEYNVNYIVT